MRASVASLSKKFISTFFAATLAVSLVPATALAVDSDAANAADSEAIETNSDTSTEANVNRPDIISTVAVLESNENEVSAPSTSSAVLDGPMDDASASVDGEKENREDVIVDDESSSSILAGGIINQTHPLQVVAQQESTRSYFLAQTLESIRTIPVVSAQLPIDTGNAEQPAEGQPGNGEETNGADDTGTIVGTIAAASTVVGSFEYLGMTFAIESDGASVALMAVDYSKLPEAFIEKQVIVVPESVTPDGIDYYSVTRIADEAFASLKKENANPDYVGCEALLSDEELLAEAGIDSTDLGEDDPLAGCTGILALGIPATVTKIEDDAFSGFETLQYLVVADGNPQYTSFDGALYSADRSQLRLIPEGRVGAVCVASSVTEVDPEVFSHCPSVETLVTDADSADNQLPRGDVSAISRLVETAILDEAFIESLIFELSANAEFAPLALETVSSYAGTAYTVTFTGSGTVQYTRRFTDRTKADQIISTQTLNNQTWSKASTCVYSSVSNTSIFINDTNETSEYFHFYRLIPINPGFSCTGWTFAGSTIANWGSTYPTKAGALVPVWAANTITMTWNCNGGNTISDNKSVTSVTTSKTYAANAKVTMPTTLTPSKSGYNFTGWFTAASGGTQVTANTSLPTSNTTYYAQWTAIIPYNATFKWSGSATCEWTKRYRDANGNMIKDVVESSETLTNANKVFSTTYLYSSGTNVSVFSVQHGLDTTGYWEYFWRVIPSNPGYTCSGWKLNGTAFSAGIGSAMASGTFEPTWTANLYTITWDAGDGTNGTISADVTKQTFGNAIKLPPNPTREGYKFLGWYNAQTDGKSVHPVTGDIKTVEADTKEYFAHWSDDPVPGIVTLKAPVGAAFTRNQVITYNNATGTHPSVTYVNESELIITYTVDTKNFSLDVLRPSRDGCEFANWTPAVTAPVWNKTSEVYAEATYTAVFDEFDYVITYVDEENKPLVGWTDKDGNFAENILTFGYNGATEPALPVLKKRGYAWEKWTVKGSQTAITEVPKGSSDITIVAHFTALPYVIEIDFDGGRSEGDVYKQTLDMDYNAPKWTLPPNEDHNLKKDGYRFSHFAAYKSKSDFENDATSFVYAKVEPGETRTMLGLGDSEADDIRYVRAVWTERIAVDVPIDVSFGVLVDFSDQKLHFQYGKTSYDATAAKDTLAPLTFTSYTTAPLGIVAVEAESDATETSKVFDEKADQVSVTLSGDSADSVVHMVGLRQTLTPPPGTDRLAGLDLAAATTAGMPTTIRFGLDFGDLAFDEIAFNESATIARLHYTVAILKDGATTAGSSVLGPMDGDGEKVVW